MWVELKMKLFGDYIYGGGPMSVRSREDMGDYTPREH